MEVGTKRAVPSAMRGVLVGAESGELSKQLAQELEHVVNPACIWSAATPARLRQMVAREKPEVIILDDRILNGAPLAESLGEFVASAAVILIAPYGRQPEVARLVATGQVEFVPRANESASLVTSLMERRLRWAEDLKSAGSTRGDALRDIGEIFRHEINNPLTGILGNAEMLLAHSDRFPAAATQRIRTVVELAVRLRETVRRVSNTLETEPHL
jgi:signal transduction histidine kinase